MPDRPVHAVSHAVFCPLGNTSGEVFDAVKAGKHALHVYPAGPADRPVCLSRLLPAQLELLEETYGKDDRFSLFEQMCLFTARQALNHSGIDPAGKDCIFILATTKGNIEWLGKEPDGRINLFYTAQLIGTYFGNPNPPLVVSNACISGSAALIAGKRLLATGRYKHAVVIGCDRVSDFVVAGFQSFQALSSAPCRPFDAKRDGLNLGEAAACIILSATHCSATDLAILAGGRLSNDANHLSGPSRTGAELAAAVAGSLQEAGIYPGQIGMISAHGTATPYNDEMEAKAFALAQVTHAPLHSLKSYVGHTLGASGIIESIIACMAMNERIAVPSLRFAHPGVSAGIRVSTHADMLNADYVLKTSSGFGGCNAALIWQKLKQV